MRQRLLLKACVKSDCANHGLLLQSDRRTSTLYPAMPKILVVCCQLQCCPAMALSGQWGLPDSRQRSLKVNPTLQHGIFPITGACACLKFIGF